MRIHRGRVAAIVGGIALVVASLAVGAPASAGWAGATGGTGCSGAVNMAGDATISFTYSSVASDMSTSMDWNRTQNLDPTDLVTSVTPSTSADVVVYENSYTTYCGQDWWSASGGGGVTGFTTCDSLLSNNRCKQHSIRFSGPWAAGASLTNRRYVACHESGHAVGLTHSTLDTTCMKYNDSSPVTVYNSTEKGYINSAY